MPTLPTLDTLGPRPQPTPQIGVQSINLGQTENAVAGVGDAMQQIDEHLTTARRAGQLTDALGRATEALGAKELQYKHDPDFATVPTRFKVDATTIGDATAAGINDPAVQRLFRNEYSK